MKLKDLLNVIRDTTRICIIDNKGNHLTANLHKKDITSDYNERNVENICVRYNGNGHSVRFYLLITIG